ncbi:MAG TPA: chromosome partitioning protein ParA, partial [Rhodocyclaceae bacterium]|nr:chromosome partitioning protein ParA [Rhodocyclaceae bacterium]
MIPRWLYPIAPLLFAASMAAADPPGRVGRISLIAGTVSLQRAQTGEWEAAALNWPVTGGDAIETWGGARAELRIG